MTTNEKDAVDEELAPAGDGRSVSTHNVTPPARPETCLLSDLHVLIPGSRQEVEFNLVNAEEGVLLPAEAERPVGRVLHHRHADALAELEGLVVLALEHGGCREPLGLTER